MTILILLAALMFSIGGYAKLNDSDAWACPCFVIGALLAASALMASGADVSNEKVFSLWLLLLLLAGLGIQSGRQAAA